MARDTLDSWAQDHANDHDRANARIETGYVWTEDGVPIRAAAVNVRPETAALLDRIAVLVEHGVRF